MIKAPLPSNETERLADLKDCKILDTAPEPAYDDLTKLASHICGMPVALISLVDRDRQWFKSRVGLDATQTPREDAFCAHAILEKDMLVVPDAKEDERFFDNPLVVNDPGVRFYAGVPLVTPRGHGLGTLCVIDQQPRDLEPASAEALRILARQVVAQIELHRSSLKLREAWENSDHLLLRVLPPSVADRIKQGENHIADSFDNAVVLVAEAVDFSLVTEPLPPVRQVDVLRQVFCCFDKLVEEKGLQNLKARGVTYYAVGCVPNPHPDPVNAAAKVALEMQAEASKINIEGVGPFCPRIGIACGPVMAGVIGTNLLGYDLWGPTIDAADAMKASAPPGGIQITQAVYEQLSDDFLTESRGRYYVADLGEVICHLLKGRLVG